MTSSTGLLPTPRRPRLVYFLLAIPLLYLFLMATMYLLQNKIIFPGAGRPDVTPANLELPFEDIRLDTPDGVRLAAWFIPGAALSNDAGSAAPPNGSSAPVRKPCVFMCEGNAEHRGMRVDQLFYWQRLGVHTFVWDYRGYGDSTGKPTLQNTRADVQQALQYLLARPDVDPAKIIFDGHSLGSGVCATLLPDFRPAAIVLEAPFSSLAEAAQDAVPYLPVRWLLKDNYDTAAKLPDYDGPVLIMASRKDELFKMEHAHRLHRACKNGTLVWDDGAHPDQRQGSEYGNVIEAFLTDNGLILPPREENISPPRREATK